MVKFFLLMVVISVVIRIGLSLVLPLTQPYGWKFGKAAALKTVTKDMAARKKFRVDLVQHLMKAGLPSTATPSTWCLGCSKDTTTGHGNAYPLPTLKWMISWKPSRLKWNRRNRSQYPRRGQWWMRLTTEAAEAADAAGR